MTKTKEIQIPTDVQRAGQAWLQARKVKLELLAALEAARSEEQRLESILANERAKDDLAGPRAHIVRPYVGGKPEPVVIVKRTAATVWTRPIGSSRVPQQWRKNAHHDGVKRWRDYPGPCMRWLEIPGEEA